MWSEILHKSIRMPDDERENSVFTSSSICELQRKQNYEAISNFISVMENVNNSIFSSVANDCFRNQLLNIEWVFYACFLLYIDKWNAILAFFFVIVYSLTCVGRFN